MKELLIITNMLVLASKYLQIQRNRGYHKNKNSLEEHINRSINHSFFSMQLYIHTCHAHTKNNDESAYIDSCKYNIGLRKIKRTYIRIVACVCVCVCVCARTLSHPVVSDSLQTLGLNCRETDFNFFSIWSNYIF